MASQPFVAEIALFPFNFAPKGWATCDGQLLPISQNTALFSLLGTFYGGDGKSTFALPNLQGACPMQSGQGNGLSGRFLGEQSGVDFISLLESEVPVHVHTVQSTLKTGAGLTTANAINAFPATGTINLYSDTPAPVDLIAPLHTDVKTYTDVSGGSLPHNNMQPYLTINFCIAMQGVFPPRT